MSKSFQIKHQVGTSRPWIRKTPELLKEVTLFLHTIKPHRRRKYACNVQTEKFHTHTSMSYMLARYMSFQIKHRTGTSRPYAKHFKTDATC